jgi:hypothetical protein
MATYVNDLRLKEIATGDSAGTWGTETNVNLELIAEAMGHGAEAIANASTHTITMADGVSDEFRSTFLRLTGGGQACTVTLAPNTLSHTWVMRNETSYTLICGRCNLCRWRRYNHGFSRNKQLPRRCQRR